MGPYRSSQERWDTSIQCGRQEVRGGLRASTERELIMATLLRSAKDKDHLESELFLVFLFSRKRDWVHMADWTTEDVPQGSGNYKLSLICWMWLTRRLKLGLGTASDNLGFWYITNPGGLIKQFDALWPITAYLLALCSIMQPHVSLFVCLVLSEIPKRPPFTLTWPSNGRLLNGPTFC